MTEDSATKIACAAIKAAAFLVTTKGYTRSVSSENVAREAQAIAKEMIKFLESKRVD